MMIGTQLLAPNGYKSLAADATYYFLNNFADKPFVNLAWFWKNKCGQPNGVVIRISRSQFEEGLLTGDIVTAQPQRETPFWFGDTSYEDLSAADSCRTTSERTLDDHIEARYLAIAPVLEQEREVLSSDDPNLAINRIARASRKNETRIRAWFLVYLVFGRERWALCPPFFNIGGYSRAKAKVKVGRHSLAKGKNSGWRVDEGMAETIEKSYVRYREAGVTLTSIYSQAMLHSFGCKTRTNTRGFTEYFHPNGAPFPSYGQYRYHVLKEFSHDDVRRSLYGEVRTRNKFRASEGRYSNAVANLLEQVEADGRYTKDHPTSPYCGTLLPKLCVVAISDVASSCTVGMGFSLNAEVSDAYRMALFSMAIPKQRFAALFGLSLSDDDWECEGLSPFLTADNGPGKKVLASGYNLTEIPIRGSTPTSFGQSKATVETSNPRQIRTEGTPTYIQSDLSPLEMAKREILRVVKDNHKRDVSAKLTPDMVAAGVVPSPAGVWKFLSERGRTDASPMTFENAVRKFLSKETFTLLSDGAYFLHRRFDSAALRATGVLDQVATGQRIKIQGYILDMCVRAAWVEIHGRIIEVEAILPLRDSHHQLSISLTELQALASARSTLQSGMREHQHATESKYQEEFLQQTGKAWHAGKQKTGPAKCRSKKSRQANTEAAMGTAHRSAR